MQTLLAIGVFCAVLGAAAAVDVARDRIPNLLPPLLALGAVLVLPRTEAEWLSRGASFAIVSVTVLVLYLARGLGGGDVKLLAAASLWMPLATLPVFALALAMAGGLQGAATLAARRVRRQAVGARRGRSMPYGLSIAAAGFVWAWVRWRSSG